MIQGIIELFATDNSGKLDEFVLHTQFDNASRLGNFGGKGIEKLLMGLINQPSQSFDKDVGCHTKGGVVVTESYGFSKFDVIFGYMARPTIFQDV